MCSRVLAPIVVWCNGTIIVYYYYHTIYTKYGLHYFWLVVRLWYVLRNVFFVKSFFGVCMAINLVSVQYNDGLLPDILMLLIQCYYHWETRLNAEKTFVVATHDPT